MADIQMSLKYSGELRKYTVMQKRDGAHVLFSAPQKHDADSGQTHLEIYSNNPSLIMERLRIRIVRLE